MTSVQKENSSTLGEAAVESFFKKPAAPKSEDTVKKSPPPKAEPAKSNNFDDVLTGGFKTLDLDDEH